MSDAALLADEATIRRLIPHSGSMCLLQSVVECSAERIVCHSATHQNPKHPLAIEGQLSALHLVEYAAQASALHGALLAPASNPPKPGVLAAVRDLHLQVQEISQLPAPLVLSVTCLSQSAAGSHYRFTAHAQAQLLAEGRFLVMTAT